MVGMSFLLLMTAMNAVIPGGELTGQVVSGLDGTPLTGVRVEFQGTDSSTTTDANGRYRLAVPSGSFRMFFHRVGFRARWLVNQDPSRQQNTRIHLWPERIPPDFQPGPGMAPVLLGSGPGPAPEQPVHLPRSPLLVPVPVSLPDGIRVARYFSVGCTGEPTRVDTLDLEDYVKGVVAAEVGVFASVPGGPEAAAECFKAFAVAARSYALHFILSQPYDGYDINDTACNQRYDDERDADVDAAVEATRGQILVKADDPDVLDRYFYAASCAHHGTEPAYGKGTILPDPTTVRACVGSWCGHDSCAGHADNPDLEGSDKCLVWGLCQWGAIERSMAGDSYLDILAHYQPGCTLRDFGTPPADGGVADGGEPASDPGGCGCHAGSSPGISAALVLLWLVILRRRAWLLP